MTKVEKAIVGAAVVICISIAVIGAISLHHPKQTVAAHKVNTAKQLSGSFSATDVLYWTNKERTAMGIPAVKLNDQVSQASAKICSQMERDNYYAHVDPVTGVPNSQVVINTMGNYYVVNENIAEAFYGDAQFLLDTWVNSADHKKTLDEADLQYMGYADCDAPNGLKYYVQDFWSPAQQAAQVNTAVSENPSGRPYNPNDASTWPLCDAGTIYSVAYHTPYCIQQ